MDRRKLIKYGAGAAVVTVGAGALINRRVNPSTSLGYDFPDAPAEGQKLAATPACGEDWGITPSQIEGPYYTPDTPLRTNLREEETVGEKMALEGFVVDRQCKPIAGAVLDFWSCDGDGVYDNEGFRLRGHQFTDANGAYLLDTIRPSAYVDGFADRTAHIHVKVQGPDTQLLTTQLYFPGEEKNAGDMIFDEALLVQKPHMDRGVYVARFDFVLA